MEPRDLRVTQNAYFHSEHIPSDLLIFCDTTAGIEGSFWMDRGGRQTEGQIDLEIETVIYISTIFRS